MRRVARTALLPAVLTALAIASQFVTTVTLARDPAWLPTFGSPVVAATLRETLLALGMLVVLAGACALGYREARHRDVSRAYLRYVGVVFAAGATALLLILAGAVVTGGSAGSSPFLTALVVTATLVAIPGVLTVAALAGVTIASARGGDASVPSTQDLLPFGLAVGAVAGIGYLLDDLADLAMAAGDSIGIPTSLPQFGTVGTTIVTYVQAGQLASNLVLVGGGIALGVIAVRRHGVATLSRRFVGVVATGALGGLLAAWFPVTWYVTADGPNSFASAAASLPSAVVSTAVVLMLAVIAGLGVAQFETEGTDSGESGSADDPGFEATTEPR